jgi:hypothetical protein
MYQEQFAIAAEAVRRERYFKTGKGRDDLKRILAVLTTTAELDRGRHGDPSKQRVGSSPPRRVSERAISKDNTP